MSGGKRTGIAVVGLVLLSGTLSLWVRGFSHGHVAAVFVKDGRVGGILSSRGRLLLVVTNVPLDARRAWTAEMREVGDDDARSLVRLFSDRAQSQIGRGGFSLARGTFQEVPGSWYFVAAAPHAVLVGLLALPPLVWARRRWVLWRRSRRGMCLACGYDLRGGGGRCPECGWERQAGPTEAGQPVA